MLEHKLVEPEILVDRIHALPIPDEQKNHLAQWVRGKRDGGTVLEP
jgi:hypothetical protein